MKRVLLLILALTVLAGCQTGPSAFDMRMAAMDEDFRRMKEESDWRLFRQTTFNNCTRALAFDKDIMRVDNCDKYQYNTEVTSKVQQIKDEFAKMNLNPARAEIVKAGKIRTGMTKDEVRLSWGPPYTVNRTVTTGSTHEQWVYGDEYNSKTYLYFDDGVLTAWQD